MEKHVEERFERIEKNLEKVTESQQEPRRGHDRNQRGYGGMLAIIQGEKEEAGLVTGEDG